MVKPLTSLSLQLEENPYAPQPVPLTSVAVEGSSGGHVLENGEVAAEAQNGGIDNAMVTDFGAPEDAQGESLPSSVNSIAISSNEFLKKRFLSSSVNVRLTVTCIPRYRLWTSLSHPW